MTEHVSITYKLDECDCSADNMPFGRCCKAVAWLKDDESMAKRLNQAGWKDSGDSQWSGAESLRLEILELINKSRSNAK